CARYMKGDYYSNPYAMDYW
nr:immunoglobulin heavy chain junction region [Mus musculus]MBK4187465.1 immunoglobulin heavy chain junction region [Mus musculus]MBK4187466.1 immunoglobulin heavy chain junction region [Mus musculus]MBK4187467.1 immunoglobulin heavy chain junction region [Mus musculus]MBK4187468.1 immunoglobulin heavy chain junction region [Mus musculus]